MKRMCAVVVALGMLGLFTAGCQQKAEAPGAPKPAAVRPVAPPPPPPPPPPAPAPVPAPTGEKQPGQ